MSKVFLVKDDRGQWWYGNREDNIRQPASTTAFMEGRLGICCGYEYEVKLDIEGQPNARYHVHVIGHEIISVERHVYEDDVCSSVEEVDSFEFETR